MKIDSSRLAIAFACIGHFTVHLLIALFLTVVLVLEREWGLDYDRLIALWTPGALMVGLGAPLAGWLSDRWGEARVMVVFFVGAGAATILAGLAQSPLQLAVSLALLGLFASIYHPVGTSWAIRNAARRGKVIGIVGLVGGFGAAFASLAAGGLSDLVGWRAAFIVPGGLSLAAGGLLLWAVRSDRLVDRQSDINPEPEASRADQFRAFAVLSVNMLLFSTVYWAFTTALPKWLSSGLGNALGQGIFAIGALVTVIYLVGNTTQLVGGYLIDRWSAKRVYLLSFLVKLPALIVAAQLGGWPIVWAAMVIVFMFDISSPAESILIAKYAPNRRRGLAYGIRNGAGLVAAPLGVQLVAWSYGWFEGFAWLFLGLGALVLVMLLTAFFLPEDRPRASASATASSH